MDGVEDGMSLIIDGASTVAFAMLNEGVVLGHEPGLLLDENEILLLIDIDVLFDLLFDSLLVAVGVIVDVAVDVVDGVVEGVRVPVRLRDSSCVVLTGLAVVDGSVEGDGVLEGSWGELGELSGVLDGVGEDVSERACVSDWAGEGSILDDAEGDLLTVLD